MNSKSRLEKICETNSGGHASGRSSWPVSHSSITAGRCPEADCPRTHTSINTRRTAAPISAVVVPITSPPPSPGTLVLLVISDPSQQQFFGIALPSPLLFWAQGKEHRPLDAVPKAQDPGGKSQNGRGPRTG